MEGIEEIEQLEKEREEISERLNKAHEKYGVWIRLQREYSKISLRDFAKKIGISAPYLSDIERGNRHASKHVRGTISKAIDDCRTLLIEEARKIINE